MPSPNYAKALYDRVYLDDHNFVQADIFVLDKKRLTIIGEKTSGKASDLFVEIISESSANRDLVQQIFREGLGLFD